MTMCKGDWSLGTACGECKRCVEGLRSMLDFAGLTNKALQEQIIGEAPLKNALRKARQDIIYLAESGTNRIRECGGSCDDPERTYRVFVEKIDKVLGK